MHPHDHTPDNTQTKKNRQREKGNMYTRKDQNKKSNTKSEPTQTQTPMTNCWENKRKKKQTKTMQYNRQTQDMIT